MRRSVLFAFVGGVALLLAACDPGPFGSTVGPVTFETFALGDVNGQNGWAEAGEYDTEVDTESAAGAEPSDFGFGTKALRMSNSSTSSSVDHTYSAPTGDHAGEVSGGPVTGTRRGYFEASWSFADADPAAEQEGLAVQASPDRGDGKRMSLVQMADCSPDEPDFPFEPLCDGPEGLEVDFFEYDPEIGPAGANGGFVQTTVASGLSRSEPHTIRVRMWFFDGVDNDVVEVCVDDQQCASGGSWEDFYRELATPEPTYPVDSVQFHTYSASGSCTCAGNGFFIDNFVAAALDEPGAHINVASPTKIIEGDTLSRNATFTVTLSEPLPFQVATVYNAHDETATSPDDYTRFSGDIVFHPGETVRQVTIPVFGDTLDEAHETFHLDLRGLQPVFIDSRNPGEPSGTFVTLDDPTPRATILDDDSTVRLGNASITEPTSGSATMQFQVALDNPSAVAVTVRVSTSNGSANAPGDYSARSNVILRFNPGQTTKTFNVSIKRDTLVEPNEQFHVNLSGASNATIGDGSGTGTIIDSD